MLKQVTNFAFYNNRDNPEEFVLLKEKDGVVTVVDSTSLTKIVLGVDDDLVQVDSINHPTAFQWPVVMQFNGQPVNGIRLKLGLAGLAAKTYGDCRLTVYNATTWVNGLVWTEALKIKVRD